MSKLRRLSGDDVMAILAVFGFQVHAQRGSHVKLRRVSASGETQTLTIPRHRELDRGTLRAIFRQAARYVPEQELASSFYVPD